MKEKKKNYWKLIWIKTTQHQWSNLTCRRIYENNVLTYHTETKQPHKVLKSQPPLLTTPSVNQLEIQILEHDGHLY